MISRVGPSYTSAEIRAALLPARDAVMQFERELAEFFGTRYAFVFPYGRSAIHTALSVLGAPGQVVQPAYNCVVVAHATLLSGHHPIFVDCGRDDPNQDAEAMIHAVNAETAAVVPTSIFGRTFDAETLAQAIRRKNPRAFVLMDCAQAFDARWNGNRLVAQGDAAVLAFGIGKAMTTLFGGALLTNHEDFANRVRRFRHEHFRNPAPARALLRLGYFIASWIAVTEPGTNLFDLVERSGTQLFKALRSREKISLPPDNQVAMTNLEAAIGRVQLPRLTAFIARRTEISNQYARELNIARGIRLPDWQTGSTHTIYTLRIDDASVRPRILEAMRRRGVQGGTVLDYIVPDLACYRASGIWGDFPNARAWAARALNLPNQPTLTPSQVTHCAAVLRAALNEVGV